MPPLMKQQHYARRFPPVSARVSALIRNVWRFKDAGRTNVRGPNISILYRMERNQAAARRLRAAGVIQRAWRSTFRFRTTRRIVQKFMALGLSSEYVQSVSDETTMSRLTDPVVIATTKACLQRVHLLTTFRHGSPPGAPERVGIKPFLMSLRIAFHPDHVFENSTGPIETALIESAAPLVVDFERILRRVAEGGSFQAVPSGESCSFEALLSCFLKRFHEWSAADRPRLLQKIKHTLVALQMQLQLESLDADLRTRMQAKVDELRGRLRQMEGDEGLRAFDAAASVVRPEYRDGMTNEQLAHELLLNPTFQIHTPLRMGSARLRLHQQYWDTVTGDLQQTPPSLERVFGVLREIRTRLLKAGGFGICEAIDIDHIRAHTGPYPWSGCVALVASATEILLRLQPSKAIRSRAVEIETDMRSAEAEDHPRVFVSALRFLLDGVEDLEVGETNARIGMIAPRVLAQGFDYERNKFHDMLAAGTLTLERTTRWLRSVVERGLLARSFELPDLMDCQKEAYLRVHSAAMVSLVVDAVGPITSATCPETLRLDVDRLEQLRQEFLQMVAAMTLAVSVTQFFTTSGDMSTDRPVLLQIQSRLADARPLESIQPLVDDVGDVLRQSSLSENDRAQFIRAVFTGPVENAPVRELMAKRARAIWQRVLEEERSGPDIEHTPTSFTPRIEKAAAQLLVVAKLNRTVHLLHYRGLIMDAARELAMQEA